MGIENSKNHEQLPKIKNKFLSTIESSKYYKAEFEKQKKEFLNASRKNLDELKKTSSSNIKSVDIDKNPKYEKMKENKEYFENNYKKFNAEICGWLNLNNNLSLSLIERESLYDKEAKSHTGADGYMQLTYVPFEDMGFGKNGRGGFCLKYIKEMPDSVISQVKNKKIQYGLNKIKFLAYNSENKKEWDKIADFFEKNRTDPHLNLIIGNLFLTFLKNDETHKDGKINNKRIDDEVKKLEILIKKLGTKKAGKKVEERFKALLSEKGIDVKNGEHELKTLLLKLKNKNNIDLRTSFYALSKYNGETRDEFKDVPHRTLYAATVLTAKKGRDLNAIV